MKAVFTIFFGLLLQTTWGQDTINQTDRAGLKQGQWIIKNDSKRPDYSKDAIIEKGKFLNNKKEGLWTMYYPNGKIKMEITFQNNRPNGYCKMYYENGCLQEEGIWKSNRWDTATYKLYGNPDSCGKQMPRPPFKNNSTGKRDGKQRYGLQGKVMLTGCWFSTGDTLKSEKFNDLKKKADYLYSKQQYKEAKTIYVEACEICCDTELQDRLNLIGELLKQK